MDPPEEREPIRYTLGDVCEVKDMVDGDDNLLAVARLKPNDPCFVLRSGGRFTFAKVISRQRGPEANIELLVDDVGSTKTIFIDQFAKYVRTFNSMVKAPLAKSDMISSEPSSRGFKARGQGLQKLPFPSAPHLDPDDGQQVPPPEDQFNLHSSFRSERNAPKMKRTGLKKAMNLRTNLQSTPDPGVHSNRQRRRSRNKGLSLHSSFQTGLNLNNAKMGRPGLTKQSSLQADFQSTPDLDDHNDGQQRSSRKEQLGLHSSFQSGLSRVELRRTGVERQSKADPPTTLDLCDSKNVQRRQPLEKQTCLHSSFQSGLNNVQLRPSCSTFQSGLNASPGIRSRRLSSLRSSIQTFIPEDSSSDAIDEFLSDNELSSVEDLDNDVETSSKSNVVDRNDGVSSSSNESDEESPRPQSLGSISRNEEASVKRAPLPGGFDDLEFNKEALLAAFSSIGYKPV